MTSTSTSLNHSPPGSHGQLEEFERLESLDPETIPMVPHQGEWVPVKVVDVYDGDSIKVIFFCGALYPMKISIRLYGIDTPEIHNRRQVDPETRAKEKQVALMIRDHVRDILGVDQKTTTGPGDSTGDSPPVTVNQRFMRIIPMEWDKYGGRILARLEYYQKVDGVRKPGQFRPSPGHVCLSQYLEGLGLARKYFGGKKDLFTMEELTAMETKLNTIKRP